MALKRIYADDLTPDDKKDLEDFKRNGCPGIGALTDLKTYEALKLYMSGKTYSEISKCIKIKKIYIIYIADRAKWHENKIKYFGELSTNLLSKVHQARVNSANTITTMIESMTRYYNEKFDKYLTTNDPTIIEGIDHKILSQYYKSIEMLDKLIATKTNDGEKKKSSPSVNININSANPQDDAIEVDVEDQESQEDQEDEKAKTNAEILKLLAKQKSQ